MKLTKKKKTFLWAMAYFKYSSNENSNGKTIQYSFVLVKMCISKVDRKCARISNVSKAKGESFRHLTVITFNALKQRTYR